MIDKTFFIENQRVLLYILNSPIGGFFRRGLWIPDKHNKITKLTPESCHVLLPDGSYQATIYSNKQYQEALLKNYRVLWESLHAWDMRLANRFMPALNAGFDTYTSQPDDTTGIDTYLDNGAATTNYNTTVRVNVGEDNTTSRVYRTLIKFDYSSISSGAFIGSCVHSFWTELDRSSNSRDFKIYRSLRAWVESQATWNIWSTSNNWTTAGAGSDGSDTDLSTVLATRTMSATETVDTEMQWTFSSTGLTELQKIVNGTYANNGYLVKADTETEDAYTFHSSSAATSGFRPKQVIAYSSAGFFAWL